MDQLGFDTLGEFVRAFMLGKVDVGQHTHLQVQQTMGQIVNNFLTSKQHIDLADAKHEGEKEPRAGLGFEIRILLKAHGLQDCTVCASDTIGSRSSEKTPIWEEVRVPVRIIETKDDKLVNKIAPCDNSAPLRSPSAIEHERQGLHRYRNEYRESEKPRAIGLAKLDANVVAVMRDSEKSKAALAEIKTKSGKNESVVHMAADLSSQKSIREFVKEFNARFDRLDVLLNNAGVSQFKRMADR